MFFHVVALVKYTLFARPCVSVTFSDKEGNPHDTTILLQKCEPRALLEHIFETM
jgi:hypothetical protein